MEKLENRLEIEGLGQNLDKLEKKMPKIVFFRLLRWITHLKTPLYSALTKVIVAQYTVLSYIFVMQ